MNKNSYFGFLVIASAMLGAMALSSCSHDDFGYSEEKVEQAVNAKYAAAFEKAFGKVGSDVDWGFSNKIYDARAITRAGGEVYEPTITFPNDYNDNLFFADVPDGVNKASGSEVNGGEWYIDGTFQQFAMRLTGILYVKGTVDLSVADGFEVNAGTKIYLVKGATLKIGPNSAWNLKGDIYIADGATLETTETTEKLKINGASKVYTQRAITTQDGGIIKVKDLEVNSTSILYNSGTVKATGTVSVESNSSRIVNNGEIECKDVVVNAGAVRNFLNWNVKGTTYINSNNSGWVNNGHWTTIDYVYKAGSVNVINNCSLEVTSDFDMNISSLSASGDQAFKINTGGSVVTTNFCGGRNFETGAVTGGPFRINMAENSLFKVEETAILESGRGPWADRSEIGMGFFGPLEGGYAVFQAKDIKRDKTLSDNKNHGAVDYSGHLYVSAESHFAQGYDSDGTGSYARRPFIYELEGFKIENNIYTDNDGDDFNSGKPNVTIDETDCSPGFQGDEGGDPLYRVIAEDLSAAEAGDFDFNDVVFDVVKAEGGYTTLRLICAGGVLPLRVRGANEAEGREVHEVFGDETPMLENHPMYNTGRGPEAPATEFTVEGTYTDPASIKTIIIEVYKENQWMELTATRGKAACKILVDDTFVPVSERSNIADKYGLFTDYVQGAFPENEDFWWKKQ